MPSIFNSNIYDNFFGIGGDVLPDGKRKSRKSGYCEHCSRRHSVDFVHDAIEPMLGIAVLGFTINAFSGLFRQN